MTLLRTRSFLLGATLASLTWAVVIYLYVTLLQEPGTSPQSQHRMLPEADRGVLKAPTERPAVSRVVEGFSHAVPLKDNLYLKKKHKQYYEKKKNMIDKENRIDYIKRKQKFKGSWSEDHGKEGKMEDRGRAGEGKQQERAGGGGAQAVNGDDDEMLAELGLVKTHEDQQEKDKGYRLHAFNTLISARLSPHRTIPDTRNKRCQDLKYPSELPTASVVICFYREDHPTLLRTVHSILDRSPPYLLQEILLIDDTDEDSYHAEVLDEMEGISNKIRVVRTPQREGLIRARVFGARQATAQVLVFLDSHVEVNVGWMEPLLARVAQGRSHVVTPIIDVISPDTFKYTASPLVRGGFNWGLHFKWDSIPATYFADKENFVKPIQSATMAGGLFAMDRTYFRELGEYDTGMEVWGGENLEMSFRIWMCGGTLEIMPCSRVGHIFRRRRPYGGPDGQDSLLRNSLRVANVWLDEFKSNFYQIRPGVEKYDYGDISSRLKLRQELECKPFSWYLSTIYPELGPLAKEGESKGEVANGVPAMAARQFHPWHKRPRNYTHKWQIRLTGTHLCAQSEGDPSRKGGSLELGPCDEKSKQQSFYHTDHHELVLAQLLCLAASDHQELRMKKCHEMGGNQEWRVTHQMGIALYNVASGLCVAAEKEKSKASVHLSLCSTPKLATWDLVDIL